MVDRNHGDGLAAGGDLLQLCGDLGRDLRFQELDLGSAAEIRRGVDGKLELPREGLIEGLVRALQDEAQPVLRQILLQPLPDQAGGVIADRVGGFVDAARGFLAHRQAAVEHPVDRGDADAGGFRQIGNGRPLGHQRMSPDAENPSSIESRADVI